MKVSALYFALFLCVVLNLAAAKDMKLRAELKKRVIGGQNAKFDSYPWQVLIVRPGSEDGPYCGGAIIAADWILTDAQCVQGLHPREMAVFPGLNVNEKPFPNFYKVKKIISHDNWDDHTFNYDVALLQLETKISFTDRVKTVQLPKQDDKIAVGAKCMLTGWGLINSKTYELPKYLQEAELTVADHQSCARKMQDAVDKETMLCADGQGSKAACLADFGAPLVCKEGGQYVLRGLASWAGESCDPSYYTVFARVSKFVDWINLKICQS